MLNQKNVQLALLAGVKIIHIKKCPDSILERHLQVEAEDQLTLKQCKKEEIQIV